MLIIWCDICRGQFTFKCPFCKQWRKDIIKKFPRRVAEEDNITETKKLLKKFNMSQTGCITLDLQCKGITPCYLER